MLNYRVKVLPNEHALDVEMMIDGKRDEIFLEVPTWVPGAYGFMRYGRDIVDVRAFDAVSGSPLTVERRGNNAFRIDAVGNHPVGYREARRIKVTYKVFV